MTTRVLIFAAGADYELAGRPLLQQARETALGLGDASPLVLPGEAPEDPFADLPEDMQEIWFLQANRPVFSLPVLSPLLPDEEQWRGLHLLKNEQDICIAACMDSKTYASLLAQTTSTVSSLDELIQQVQQQNVPASQHQCDSQQALAIDNPAQLAEAEALVQTRLRQRALQHGACLQDPASVHFSFDTQLEADVFVEPHVVFAPGVQVGRGARIRAFSHLEGCTIAPLARIGPYARLRPHSNIGEAAHIGNFVEVKQADIGAGAKINHLAYIGDAQVGDRANIGAGAITCNYDGAAKHRTEIGEGAFIGSNAALVAPVRIGAGASIGAGSTITEDVEANALAVARARQSAYPGRAKTTAKKDKSD